MIQPGRILRKDPGGQRRLTRSLHAMYCSREGSREDLRTLHFTTLDPPDLHSSAAGHAKFPVYGTMPLMWGTESMRSSCTLMSFA